MTVPPNHDCEQKPCQFCGNYHSPCFYRLLSELEQAEAERDESQAWRAVAAKRIEQLQYDAREAEALLARERKRADKLGRAFSAYRSALLSGESESDQLHALADAALAGLRAERQATKETT